MLPVPQDHESRKLNPSGWPMAARFVRPNPWLDASVATTSIRTPGRLCRESALDASWRRASGLASPVACRGRDRRASPP